MVRLLSGLILAICLIIPASGQSPEEDDFIPGLGDYPAEQMSDDIGLMRKRFREASARQDTSAILATGYKLFIHSIRSGNKNGSYDFLLSLRKIAQRKRDVYWMCYLTLETGALEYNSAHYDLALKYFIEAKGLSARSGYPKTEAMALNYMGRYYHSVGNFTASLKYYKEALSVAELTSDTVLIAGILNYIGNHYLTTGELVSAMEVCLRSLRLQEKGSIDPIVYGSTCNHLGNIYVELSDFQKAEQYHFRSLRFRQSVSFHEGIGKSYLNLGKLYFKTQRVDSAGILAQKAQAIFEKTGYTKGRIKVMILTGQVLTSKGAYQEASGRFDEAIRLSEITGYTKGIVFGSFHKGCLLLAQKLPEQAAHYFQRSLNLSRANGIQDAEMDNYLALQKCYSSTGDFRKASEMALQYATVRETFLMSLYTKRLADAQINYETEKSLRIRESLQADNNLKKAMLKRKNLLILFAIATLFSLLFMTIILYSRYRIKQKDNRILKELNTELKQVNREKDRFMSIIAHELRNPLWWVKNITETLSQRFETMSREQIYESLLTLDESAKNTFLLMDNLLNWSRSKLNLLPCKPCYFNVNELVQLNIDQFSVMIRQKELKISVDFLHEGKGFGDKDHYLIIFRNLLSNAIKFTPTGGRIDIRSFNRNGHVLVCVEDTGIGIDREMLSRLFDETNSYSTLGLMQEKGAGLGLKLSRDFAKKNEGDLTVTSIPNKGTSVEVLIPKNIR